MKRGEQRIRVTLVNETRQLYWFLNLVVQRIVSFWMNETASFETVRAVTGPSLPGSPLDNTGPVPVELLGDPIPMDPVPWSIREAEVERDRARQRLVWLAALVVSWTVTAMSTLRIMGIL